MDCTGRPSTPRRYGKQWLAAATCACTAVRWCWGLNGHANARSRLTAFIPCTCSVPTLPCSPQGTVPRCCAAPSQATATATAITNPASSRGPGPVVLHRPAQRTAPAHCLYTCTCTCTCACTCRRAPADIRPSRPQRRPMKQEEGGAVATTCDAAEQPVDTAF